MYLGIDLGTSSIKLVLMDDDHQVVSESSEPLEISSPQSLFSEQNPDDWWNAFRKAIEKLEGKETIQAIGLSGQMHGAVLLGPSGEVLRPAILWNDGRSFLECDELEKRVPDFAERIGTRIMPGFTAPKLLWIQKHEPEIFSKITKVLLPKDYLRFKMSGVFATDMSDASGTCWLDVGKRKWSNQMIGACDLKQSQLPEVYEGTEITCELHKEWVHKWGLSKSVPIVGGGGDNAASAISMGVVNPGDAFLSLGTSGVYFVSSSKYLPNVEGGIHTFCHCLPNIWHQMSVHLSSAVCLSWLKEVLNLDHFDSMVEMGMNTQTEILFLPYLSGIRTPYNDPYAKGVFYGLTLGSSKEEMIRSVLEGVALDFSDGQEALRKNSSIQSVSVVGGGAKNRSWGKILSSVLDESLVYRKDAEMGGALGAAKLAWVALKKTQDPAAMLKAPEVDEVIEPKNTQDYRKKKELFKMLYQQLKPCFDK